MNKEPMMNIGAAFDVNLASTAPKGVGVITGMLVSAVDPNVPGADRVEILMSNESIQKRLKVGPSFIVRNVWSGKQPVKNLPLFKTKATKVKSRAKSKRRYMVKNRTRLVKILRQVYKWLDKDRSNPFFCDADLMALYKKFKVENDDHKPYSLDNILSEDVFKKVEDKRPQSELTMKAEFNFSKVAEAVWEESSNPFGKKDKSNG